jgi:hypothetical protein
LERLVLDCPLIALLVTGEVLIGVSDFTLLWDDWLVAILPVNPVLLYGKPTIDGVKRLIEILFFLVFRLRDLCLAIGRSIIKEFIQLLLIW